MGVKMQMLREGAAGLKSRFGFALQNIFWNLSFEGQKTSTH